MSGIYREGTGGADRDEAVFEIVSFLREAGWACIALTPYVKFSMVEDMAPFGGGPDFGTAIFWRLQPVAGSDALPRIIVDEALGFDPGPGYVLIETHSVLKEVVFPIVIHEILSMGIPGKDLIEIGSDPNDDNPNTFIGFEDPGDPVIQEQDLPDSGIALHLGRTTTLGGGYMCINDPPAGNRELYMFVGRSHISDADNQPGPISIIFADRNNGHPIFFLNTQDIDRTDYIQVNLRLGYKLSASESMVVVSVSNGAHIEAASLELPVSTAGVTEAYFGVAASSTFLNTNFRNGPSCNGIMMLGVNHEVLYDNTPGKHSPRIMASLSGDRQDGTVWENGLGDDTEAWCAFNKVVNNPSPILGKFPNCIVILKSLDAVAGTPFTLDNKVWRIFSNNVEVNGDHNLGTLCFETDESSQGEGC